MGMSWRLVVPLPPSWHATGPLGFNAANARVEGRPRCPKCGTGLEEHPTVFGRYRVRCVGCDFSIRQRDSFVVLARALSWSVSVNSKSQLTNVVGRLQLSRFSPRRYRI